MAGDVTNFDEYKEYVFSKGLHYIQVFAREGTERQLKRIEAEYFRQMVQDMEKPKEMRLLLEEYIKEHNLLVDSPCNSEHPGKAWFKLMKLR